MAAAVAVLVPRILPNAALVRSRAAAPRAAASEAAQEYNLGGGSVLKVKTGLRGTGGPAYVELQVSEYDSPSLLLHWGAIKGDDRNWRIPSSSRPPGTRDFQSALQSPFGKSGNINCLEIELTDQDVSAIEFLLRDEQSDKWIKRDGNNFRVDILRSEVRIPQDLVDIYAYLRWEKKGKQTYSAEQEKREYEEALRELQEEVAKGATIEDIRARISASDKETKKKSTKDRITRKRRDYAELTYAHTSPGEIGDSIAKEPSALESALHSDSTIFKKIYKLGNKELLVAVAGDSDAGGSVHVTIATDIEEAFILRWSLTDTKEREWKKPPLDVLPAGSHVFEDSVETPLSKGFLGNESLQGVDINLEKTPYLGLPFVLRTEDNRWIKLDGSDFYIPLQSRKVKLDSTGTAKRLLDEIASLESEAERSLMHRYNIAADLLQREKNSGKLAIAGFLVWLRYMAMRQLTWNRNYNVKPREISAAQDRLTNLLQAMYVEQPENKELLRLTLSTVGRGGQGDVGQRIRDEILVIQRNNDCKGGMMEEWHQKLHNNTSPDDVVICQALLDYIRSDFDIEQYWKTLISNGVTKQRLASYDRPIVSEPRFKHEQKEGLIRDLTAYMRTLKAVHSGADLESAIATCMGYSAEGHGFMGSLNVHAINGISNELPDILSFIMDHVEDEEVLPLLEALLEARWELLPSLSKPHDRLKDILFLDLALDSTFRTKLEQGMERFTKLSDIVQIICLVLENLCLSKEDNEELVFCLKDWHNILQLPPSAQWALRAKAVLDRTRLALADKAEHYHHILQPSAVYLGNSLGVEEWAIDIFTEEMVRAGSAASLSLLLNKLDPELRNMANLGSWQVISPVDVKGFVSVATDLGDVQENVYERPTVLVCSRVKGEEEIPDGAVAVLTPDMPDILSHVSVRARNCKVLFATCFDPAILNQLRSLNGEPVNVKLKGSSDITFSKISDAELSGHAGTGQIEEAPPIVLVEKGFCGKYAISAEEFTSYLVGAKSLNTVKIRGKLPSWIKLPTSVALPFGVFEEVLLHEQNKDILDKISQLKNEVEKDLVKLKEVRQAVLKMNAPSRLIEELKAAMLVSGMPWPEKWDDAWLAIKKVWASKWNERAYISTRKARIDHEQLRMAVLVQEIVCADYAFVIHTTNPSSGNSSEIYAEVVKGLGETLVGAYSGRALSFSAPKSNLDSPKVLGYPSKRVGLFIQPSLIFRSDSNGEDLEGYAGAGLYDSVPMHEAQERVVDYSTDMLLLDDKAQQRMLSQIAAAGAEVEKIYGSAQDIEGCIKDVHLPIPTSTTFPEASDEDH